MWKEVIGSREGLVGKVTSVGLKIRKTSIFVALPDVDALWDTVAVRYKGKILIAPVLDVGPWNEKDPDYVFGDKLPLAAQGIGKYRRPSNPAGIDLSDGLIRRFGIEPKEWGLKMVEWRFVRADDLKEA